MIFVLLGLVRKIRIAGLVLTRGWTEASTLTRREAIKIRIHRRAAAEDAVIVAQDETMKINVNAIHRRITAIVSGDGKAKNESKKLLAKITTVNIFIFV